MKESKLLKVYRKEKSIFPTASECYLEGYSDGFRMGTIKAINEFRTRLKESNLIFDEAELQTFEEIAEIIYERTEEENDTRI